MGQNEIKYHSLIQNSTMGIISFINDGVYSEINPSFCGMTGFEKNDLLTTRFPNPFWPDHFFDQLEDDFYMFKKTGILKVESFLKNKFGMFFPVSITGSIIRNTQKDVDEYVLFIEDISKRKQAERELQLSQEMLVAINSKLEYMVKDRTKQLNDLMVRKNDFINQLGHDLKNPIHPLINLTPILEEKVTDSEGKEIIEILKRNIEYMRQLIVRTIALAKLNSPTIQFNYEICNLVEEINSIIENNLFTFQNNNTTITTRFNKQPNIEIDKLRFNELLVNILDNAVKYSPKGGTITIEVDDVENKYAQITVTDQGKGMNEEQLTHVFEDFYRALQTTNTLKSSGLGMSICKRIVEKHGGTIRCHSPGLGKGTSVILSLPYHQPRNIESIDLDAEKIEQLVHSVRNM